MVMGPGEIDRVLIQPENSNPDHRGVRDDETPAPVAIEAPADHFFPQPRRHTSQIHFTPWQLARSADDLKGIFPDFVDNRRPERWMSIDHHLPGSPKCGKIHGAVDLLASLLKINRRIGIEQRVKKYSPLHWREGIDVFDIARVGHLNPHSLPYPSNSATNLSSSSCENFICGKSDGVNPTASGDLQCSISPRSSSI